MGIQISKESDSTLGTVRTKKKRVPASLRSHSRRLTVGTTSSPAHLETQSKEEIKRPPRTPANVHPVNHKVFVADHVAPLSPLSAYITSSARRSISRSRTRTTTASTTGTHDQRFNDSELTSISSLASDDDYYHGTNSVQYGSSYGSVTSAASMSRVETILSEGFFSGAAANPNESAKKSPDSKAHKWLYEYGEEREYTRQLRQHYVLKQVFGGNIQIDLKTPADILESACGAGLWSLEMGHAQPENTILGIDLFPPLGVEPGPLWKSGTRVPSIGASNVSYLYANILSTPLPVPDESFDFIYQRDVATVLPTSHWQPLIRDFFRILRPNGKIQLVEYDLLYKNTGPVLALVNEWFKIGAKAIQVRPFFLDSMEEYMANAGFQDIKVTVYDIPIGEWPEDEVQREHGFLYKEQMKALFKSMRQWWTAEFGVSPAEYDNVCAAAVEEFEEYHTLATWKIFTAVKPASTS